MSVCVSVKFAMGHMAVFTFHSCQRYLFVGGFMLLLFYGGGGGGLFFYIIFYTNNFTLARIHRIMKS